MANTLVKNLSGISESQQIEHEETIANTPEQNTCVGKIEPHINGKSSSDGSTCSTQQKVLGRGS